MIRIMLRERLAEKGWTQVDLSRKTGIRAATINAMCNEQCERITLEHLDLLCQALECDLCDLLTRNYTELKELEAAARRKRINKAFNAEYKRRRSAEQ